MLCLEFLKHVAKDSYGHLPGSHEFANFSDYMSLGKVKDSEEAELAFLDGLETMVPLMSLSNRRYNARLRRWKKWQIIEHQFAFGK